jgi:diguanylate cyclase (GGDEF)-like protein
MIPSLTTRVSALLLIRLKLPASRRDTSATPHSNKPVPSTFVEPAANMPFAFNLGESLPEQDERTLAAQHDSALGQMLPMLGPFFGAAVILFVVWDYLVAPPFVVLTGPVRVALVLVGALAYRQRRWPWSALQRCGFVYATHASAMVISAALLPNGLLLGLAGIAASVFLVSLVALQLATFVRILLVPSLLLLVLGALSMPPYALLNALFLYLFAALLAAGIMLVVGAFRRQAFLAQKRLLHSARHDSLSGAANRAYLTELGNREIALARRHKHPMAAAMIDIDHFKRVNDVYGHAVGDIVIRQLVKTCTGNLREGDLFGRFGGEEFVCVMPQTDASDALACTERMRRSIEDLHLDTERGSLRFTISAGVAVLDPDHDGWDGLLKQADEALYQAKETGRNRTVLASQAARGTVGTAGQGSLS